MSIDTKGQLKELAEIYRTHQNRLWAHVEQAQANLKLAQSNVSACEKAWYEAKQDADVLERIAKKLETPAEQPQPENN